MPALDPVVVPKTVLDEFLLIHAWICRKTPVWIQGAGGNVSIKDAANNALWIKASGIRLDQVSATKGIVKLDYLKYHRDLNVLLKKHELSQLEREESYAASIANALSGYNHSAYSRASMETGFHALFSARIVAHFHALSAIVMADMWFKKNRDFSLWKEEFLADAVFVDWEKPGFELVNTLSQEKLGKIALVRNHGVILCADSLDELQRWEEIENEFLKRFKFASFKSLAAKCMAAILSDNPFLLKGPLRFYFPDTAVFLPRLRKVLVAVGSADGPDASFEILPDIEDLDALELWVATQILNTYFAGTSELAPEIVSSVANLPTEKYRIQLGSSSTR